MTDTTLMENATGTRISVPGHGPLDIGGSDHLEASDAVTELVAAGALRPVQTINIARESVADVLAWVGDDPERAAYALVTETARPEAEQRSTLVGPLEQIVPTTHPDPVEPDGATGDTTDQED